VVFSPDERWVAFGGYDLVHIWETESWQKIFQVEHSGQVGTVAFSPEGRWLSYIDAGFVRLWDTKSWQEVPFDHLEGATSVVFSPGGRYIASSGGGEGYMYLWETETRRKVSQVTIPGGGEVLMFSPDERYVVSERQEKQYAGVWETVWEVWEVETGHQVSQISYEGYNVEVKNFSPDGQRLFAIASKSNEAVYYSRIWRSVAWDVKTGREVSHMEFEGHFDNPDAILSPNGAWVLFAPCTAYFFDCLQSVAQVWWWLPEDLIDLACDRLTRNLTQEEWRLYFGEEPYRVTCPNLPPEEPLPTPQDGAVG
jgi:WD40 repeat protein